MFVPLTGLGHIHDRPGVGDHGKPCAMWRPLSTVDARQAKHETHAQTFHAFGDDAVRLMQIGDSRYERQAQPGTFRLASRL